MPVNISFHAMTLAATAGVATSVLIERMMRPKPLWERPVGAWALHVGVWLLAHAVLTLLLGRPWFSAAAVSAFMLMLVLVNNAKFFTLREPFVWPDFEYFTDTIRHPRLYIPFLGWGKFIAAALGFIVAVSIGLWGESVPATRFDWNGQLGALAVTVLLATILIQARRLSDLPVSFEVERDVVTLGLLTSLWRYAEESGRLTTVSSRFDALPKPDSNTPLPHLVAIQSESFFDARSLFPGIRTEVLTAFDRLKADGLLHGKLTVPAWGANTVRSEFAFLSGLDEAQLGVHRFNPYHAVMKDWKVSGLVSFLKQSAYRTIAIHPYPASFYQRKSVYPKLGFDEFLDIQSFTEAERFGPYVSDVAVAEKVAEVLASAEGPVFVFVVTMENHGPLHLEKVAEGDMDELYSEFPPPGCEDLTIYLRHLRNADRMIAALRKTLEDCEHPASLCWYGDHVPIMPGVYETFGTPDGSVDYVLWSNRPATSSTKRLYAHTLSEHWLRTATRLSDQ